MVRYFVFIREPGQLDLICHDQARAGLDFDRHSHAGSEEEEGFASRPPIISGSRQPDEVHFEMRSAAATQNANREAVEAYRESRRFHSLSEPSSLKEKWSLISLTRSPSQSLLVSATR
jgi:hypothetical protein